MLLETVLVLDTNRQPLMPCHPARARALLKNGKAAVFRRYPFTLILKERAGGEQQPMELKFDPGSQTSGMCLVALFKRGWTVIWAAELQHRDLAIRDALKSRRGIRRNRRNRHCRYRAPRFDNRRRPKGWLPPSIQSRVDNVVAWTHRLRRYAPVSAIAVEVARFDTQALQNPEIEGVEYQRGTLFGFEVREYLLAKWGHQCVYCGATGVPLQKDHVHPQSKGGSNRVSNIVPSCRPCNKAKDDRDVREFLAHDPERLAKILRQLKQPLRDAAAMNATRYKLADTLEQTGLPLTRWTGGRTKYNRTNQDYPKTHWLDAACVGETGERVVVPAGLKPLRIKATGRGSRQACRMDGYGFPRTKAKGPRSVEGFRTGDMVRAVVPDGKKAGTHIGRVAVRSNGYFNIATAKGTVQGIAHRYCRALHRGDGYGYGYGYA